MRLGNLAMVAYWRGIWDGTGREIRELTTRRLRGSGKDFCTVDHVPLF
jgi:hypothetical protein